MGSVIYKPRGCKECDDSGYIGRSAIGEIIIVDEEMAKAIRSSADEHKIKELAKKQEGFISMSDDLNAMILRGETSLEEALRIGIKEL